MPTQVLWRYRAFHHFRFSCSCSLLILSFFPIARFFECLFLWDNVSVFQELQGIPCCFYSAFEFSQDNTKARKTPSALENSAGTRPWKSLPRNLTVLKSTYWPSWTTCHHSHWCRYHTTIILIRMHFNGTTNPRDLSIQTSAWSSVTRTE